MKKTYFINVGLALLSLLVCFLIAEIGLRIALFSNIPLFNKLRNPAYYADYYSEDDYWKLYYIWGHDPFQNSHPLLGWVASGDFSRYNFIHNKTKYIGNRRPVLLYGDSFANCTVPPDSCFQGILNSDKAFSKGHYLLNYGVGAYGLDQIFLLFKNSINKYKNPIVIFSLMLDDLDRSILSVFMAQKPVLMIENNKLKLSKTPINQNPKEFFTDNPPQIKSYIYRLFLYSNISTKLLPKKFISFLKHEDFYKKKTIRLNEKIIFETIEELRSNNLDFIFLIFRQRDGSWRDSFVRRVLDKYNLPYIWSLDIIKNDMQVNNHDINYYFIPNDGHPNEYQNRLISEEIKKYVLRTKTQNNN